MFCDDNLRRGSTHLDADDQRRRTRALEHLNSAATLLAVARNAVSHCCRAAMTVRTARVVDDLRSQQCERAGVVLDVVPAEERAAEAASVLHASEAIGKLRSVP